MTTIMTQQGIPAVEFPIAPPPPRYPVIGKWDAGRIVPHEPRTEPWLIGTIWRVADFGHKRGGFDITAEYDAMIEREQMADIAATQADMRQEGVG
jgi:hypothetical protein